MAMPLHRFWITLADPTIGSLLGYGVTAYDEQDARSILAFVAFDGQVPEIAEIQVDVDVRDLDPGHVRPNMSPPHWRGIWFPTGFDPDVQ